MEASNSKKKALERKLFVRKALSFSYCLIFTIVFSFSSTSVCVSPCSMTSSNVDKSVSSHSTVSRTSSKANHRRRASESESDIPDNVSTSDRVLREYMDKVSAGDSTLSVPPVYKYMYQLHVFVNTYLCICIMRITARDLPYSCIYLMRATCL